MSNIKAQAKKIADALKPEDGWFHDPCTTDDLEAAAVMLLGTSLTVQGVARAMSIIINAIKNEYRE